MWARYLCPLRLAVGERLFRQGDAADGIYFLESGALGVWLELTGGQRARLGEFGPGQCIGEMAPYRRELRSATIECEGAALLWRLSIEDLTRVEAEQPAFALALHRLIAARLAERVAFSNTHLKGPLAELGNLIHDLSANQFAVRPEYEQRIVSAAVRTDEVGVIARALQDLRLRLESHITELRKATAAREQVESELRIAGRIQMSFLPVVPPPGQARRIDFAAVSRPAREAGGDLYDGFFLDERRFFFVVGDVSGKGVPAALFMAVTAMCLRALAGPGPIEDLVTRVNDLLCQRNETMQFVTICAGVLDISDGRLEWVNCGHPAPMVLGPGGVLKLLDEGRGPPLGVFEALRPERMSRYLAPGEVLLLYTDGVTEALDPNAALFGEERLERVLKEARPDGASAAVNAVLRDVESFAFGAPQADDITLLALRRLSP